MKVSHARSRMQTRFGIKRGERETSERGVISMLVVNMLFLVAFMLTIHIYIIQRYL